MGFDIYAQAINLREGISMIKFEITIFILCNNYQFVASLEG